MAFSSHRKRFQGTLENVSIERLKELDFTKETFKERLAYIENKYENIKVFYDTYVFTADKDDKEATDDEKQEYYKVNVSTNDELSSNINIFQYIERDGSYLLNSKDIARDSQYKYNILTQKEFDNLLRKEQKEGIDESAFENILKRKVENQYKNLELEITSKDLKEDSDMGRILREYEKVRVFLNEENSKIRNKQSSSMNVYKIRVMAGGIIQDMKDVKRSYKGIRRPSTKLGDIGGEPDLLNADYTNSEQIKYLLQMVKFGEINPDDLLSHLAYDLEVAISKLVKQGKLDEKDLNIIEAINAGVSMRELEKELGISNQAISKRFDKTSKKIANYFANLENKKKK